MSLGSGGKGGWRPAGSSVGVSPLAEQLNNATAARSVRRRTRSGAPCHMPLFWTRLQSSALWPGSSATFSRVLMTLVVVVGVAKPADLPLFALRGGGGSS